MHSLSLIYSNFGSYFTDCPDPVKQASPGLFSLTSLLQFHLKKYAFSTLHANINDTLPLDRLSLISRLVDARAGYCFHHNVAFFEAMKAMGYKDMFFVAGIFPKNDLPTHIAIVWKKAEDDLYLVDAGSGLPGMLSPIPFHTPKNNPRIYRITTNGSAYALEGWSQETQAYEEKYTFGIQPVSLDSEIFQQAIQRLTTSKHIFYNNFWYFWVDPKNRMWNVILTANAKGETKEKLLIDGDRQENASPFTLALSRTNDTFRAMLSRDSFVNEHLHRAIVAKSRPVLQADPTIIEAQEEKSNRAK